VHAKSIRSRPPKSRGRSSTQDILGTTNGHKIHRKWSEHQRRLFALREQFLKGRSAQSENAKESLSTSTEHIADAATDSFDRDCALALLSSAQNALYEIEQALNRIANGTYGICELSGQAIEVDRLRAIPWTRFSALAQSQLETRSGAARVQLGEVGTCSNPSDSDEALDDSEEASVVAGQSA
jgi:RNA polymerase-binding transcription factor DksA